MTSNVSGSLAEDIEPGETVYWHEEGGLDVSRRRVGWVAVAVGVCLALVSFGVLRYVLSVVTDGPTFLPAAAGAALVAVELGHATHGLLTRVVERRAYAVTDRRLLKSVGLREGAVESIPWHSVTAIDFHHDDHQRIDVRTSEKREVSFLRPSWKVRFRFADAHEPYEAMVRAWEAATGGPPLASDSPGAPATGSIPEDFETESGETVVCSGRDPGSDRSLARPLLAGATVALLVMIVLPVTTGVAVPVSTGVGLPAGTIAGTMLYSGRRTSADDSPGRSDYVLTDRWIFAGESGDLGTVPWTNVETVQRRQSRLYVYEDDPAEGDPVVEQGRLGRVPFGRTAVKPPAFAVEVEYPRRTYWALREADPQGVFSGRPEE